VKGRNIQIAWDVLARFPDLAAQAVDVGINGDFRFHASHHDVEQYPERQEIMPLVLNERTKAE
jgi:hypothetical protein